MSALAGAGADSGAAEGGLPVRDEAVYRRRLHFLLRRFKRAQRRWRLIEEGDRVLVGLSGGKDSLTLAHLLRRWRREAAESFDFAAVHLEAAAADDNAERRELLRRHLDSLGVPIEFATVDIPDAAAARKAGVRCFRCAWNRRREIFTRAHERGFNKVALGHHLDDAAETVLMNLLFHANLETMEPKVDFFGGLLTLIRPLILAEEREIVRVSSLIRFPFFGCLCSGEPRTERDRAGELIASFGRKARQVKRNLWTASRTWIGEGQPGAAGRRRGGEL